MFLVDKANIIIDATFGSERVLLETLAQWTGNGSSIGDPSLAQSRGGLP